MSNSIEGPRGVIKIMRTNYIEGRLQHSPKLESISEESINQDQDRNCSYENDLKKLKKKINETSINVWNQKKKT